jgi:hypothetical protein
LEDERVADQLRRSKGGEVQVWRRVLLFWARMGRPVVEMTKVVDRQRNIYIYRL